MVIGFVFSHRFRLPSYGRLTSIKSTHSSTYQLSIIKTLGKLPMIAGPIYSPLIFGGTTETLRLLLGTPMGVRLTKCAPLFLLSLSIYSRKQLRPRGWDTSRHRATLPPPSLRPVQGIGQFITRGSARASATLVLSWKILQIKMRLNSNNSEAKHCDLSVEGSRWPLTYRCFNQLAVIQTRRPIG